MVYPYEVSGCKGSWRETLFRCGVHILLEVDCGNGQAFAYVSCPIVCIALSCHFELGR